MSDASKYHEAQRINGISAAHRAMSQLSEHWDSVEIILSSVTDHGITIAYTLDSEDTSDEDDDDDGPSPVGR